MDNSGWNSLLQGMFKGASNNSQTPATSDQSTNKPDSNKQEADEKALSTVTESSLPSPEQVKYYPIYAPVQGLTLYELIMTRHPPSWTPFFVSAQKEIAHACSKVAEESSRTGKAIFPFPTHILAAFWLTPLPLLKAVIIGQDPYPGQTKSGLPKAIGVSFASFRHSGEVPGSLKTIYGELAATVEDWKTPDHPDITCWGRQGVLLLNTALTVEAGRAKAHVGYWAPFTEKLMEFLNQNTRDVAFLLWGKVAQNAASTISSSNHLKLIAYHPSPRNDDREFSSFKGCNHFNQANLHLVSKGIHPIDWRIK